MNSPNPPLPYFLRPGRGPCIVVLLLALGLGLLGGLFGGRADAAPGAAAQACGALYWHRVAVPGGDDQMGGVYSLAMISPTDGWATGPSADGLALLHWDGH